MKDKRFAFGIIASTLWIAIAAWMLFTQDHPKELNAWGDFLAGFSAPLAFLWLVLGYMQQGEELKQSTQALQLQAAELRSSVEQQSQLVEITRRQFEQELTTIEAERARRKILAQPVLILSQTTAFTRDRLQMHNIRIFNAGNDASDVRISILRSGYAKPFLKEFDMLARSTQTSFDVGSKEGDRFHLNIDLLDADNEPRRFETAFSIVENSAIFEPMREVIPLPR